MEYGDVPHVLTRLQAQFAFVAVGDTVGATDRVELCRALGALTDRKSSPLYTFRPLAALMCAAWPTGTCKPVIITSILISANQTVGIVCTYS